MDYCWRDVVARMNQRVTVHYLVDGRQHSWVSAGDRTRPAHMLAYLAAHGVEGGVFEPLYSLVPERVV